MSIAWEAAKTGGRYSLTVLPGVVWDSSRLGWTSIRVEGADALVALAPYFGDALMALL